jgi:hypothetical protein
MASYLEEAHHNASSKCLPSTFRYGLLALSRSLSRLPLVTLRIPASFFFILFLPICAGFFRTIFVITLVYFYFTVSPTPTLNHNTKKLRSNFWGFQLHPAQYHLQASLWGAIQPMSFLTSDFSLTHCNSSLLVRILSSSKTKYGRWKRLQSTSLERGYRRSSRSERYALNLPPSHPNSDILSKDQRPQAHLTRFIVRVTLHSSMVLQYSFGII